MQGYLIAFFTQADRRHRGHPIAEWLLTLAKEHKLPGATQLAAVQGFGHTGHLHSAHFFELTDEPQQIVIIATPEQADQLLACIAAEGEKIFYMKTPVDYGITGG